MDLVDLQIPTCRRTQRPRSSQYLGTGPSWVVKSILDLPFLLGIGRFSRELLREIVLVDACI